MISISTLNLKSIDREFKIRGLDKGEEDGTHARLRERCFYEI